jgi:hypothetical protein
MPRTSSSTPSRSKDIEVGGQQALADMEARMGLLLEQHDLSRPRMASRAAAVEPAGPPPMTRTSGGIASVKCGPRLGTDGIAKGIARP